MNFTDECRYIYIYNGERSAKDEGSLKLSSKLPDTA